MDVHEVARAINIPIERWAGNCHGIATALHGLLKREPGRLGGLKAHYYLVRGHWIGPVALSSHFGERASLPFHPHSWIEASGLTMPRSIDPPLRIDQEVDPLAAILGRTIHNPIIDPTRFRFDGKPPYIYVGESDHYDAGGNAWRAMTELPPPVYDERDKTVDLILPPQTVRWLSNYLESTGRPYPSGVYTLPLAFWLGNLSLSRMREHAPMIFSALVHAGQRAAIPLDNYNIVFSGQHGAD